MWEDPQELWRRLKLGREEYLQRLITTLIVGGQPPPWNVPRPPSEQGVAFLRLLDGLAHGERADWDAWVRPDVFVDEYLLPKVEESAPNGWPDWAALWPDRAWVIELKTEPGSHRADQLPYYSLLAAAAHPGRRVDLTYVTGAMSKPAPSLGDGQRYSHVQWTQVLPLIESVWGSDDRDEVSAYVDAVRTVVENLTLLRPAEQRAAVLGEFRLGQSPSLPELGPEVPNGTRGVNPASDQREASHHTETAGSLLELARATASDGLQRGLGATSPTHLENLRDMARQLIGALPADDTTRFVLPWLWHADRTTGTALTPEGNEFGFELRFSRYTTIQVKP